MDLKYMKTGLNKKQLRKFESLRKKWIKSSNCECDVATFLHEIESKAVQSEFNVPKELMKQLNKSLIKSAKKSKLKFKK